MIVWYILFVFVMACVCKRYVRTGSSLLKLSRVRAHTPACFTESLPAKVTEKTVVLSV